MSITEMVIKIIGIILALVGFALILSLVGVNLFGVGLAPWWLALLVGLLFLGIGIYIVRGGSIHL